MISTPSTTDSLEDIERFLRSGQDWLKKRHGEGASGAEICQGRAALMDNVLRRLWKKAVHPPGGKEAGEGVALLAMGGYGREELNLFSDVDLFLLHLPGKGKDLASWMKNILHPLWDWGLTVGYTVQSPKESCKAALKEMDLLLSFLDARWIAGDRAAVLRWEEEFSRGLKGGREKEMILTIQQSSESRHKKLGDSVFVLEPEVKEGKGGLRDYHAALWAAKIRFPLRTPRQMAERGLLNEKEWENYSLALDFLWRVRDHLHYLHGRREDRLSFEDQTTLARGLGYREEDPLRATESFLKDYFHQALRVHHLSGNVVEKCLDEAAPSVRSWWRRAAPEIAPGFHLYHGRLALSDAASLDRDPFQFWRAFDVLHRHGMELSAGLQEVFSQKLSLVNERFRSSPESVRSFLSYFEQPGHLYRVLEEMYETGFLRQFLPEFERVHCHIQYDRYHLYPVDVHSLYAVQELELLERKNGPQPWPLFEQLMGELQDPALMKLAALVHDLGKAEGASHALRGEKIARSIGALARLSASTNPIRGRSIRPEGYLLNRANT